MQFAVLVVIAVAAVCALIVSVVLARQLSRLRNELAALRGEVRSELRTQAESIVMLRNETVPALNDAQVVLRRVENENRKFDSAESLLDTAASVAGTADAASKFAYRAVSNPVIKVAALVSGTKRAAKTLVSPDQKPKRLTRTERRKAISVPSTDATSLRKNSRGANRV